MLAVRVVSLAIAVVMAVAIAIGFATAEFGTEGRAILDLTWGVITLVDIYASFTFAWLWIAWREDDLARALVWLVLVVTLGSLAIGAYVAFAAFRADSPRALLLGPNHS